MLSRRTLTGGMGRLAIVLSLTGCGGSDLPPPPRQAVVSRFVNDAPNTIEIVVVDPLPVKSARLIPQSGGGIQPDRIDRGRQVYSDDTGSGPNIGVGVSGGSASRVSTGFGIGFPLFGGGDSGTHTAAMTTSTIRFRVPDMAAYRAQWQHWVLHIDLDDGVNRRGLATLPPAPPFP